MLVACNHCQRKYSIDESRLKPGETLFKCDSCKNIIRVNIAEPTTQVTGVPAPRQADHSMLHAIQLIQAHKLREGKKLLIENLQKTPKKIEGWIWLIRTGQNYEEIEATIDKGRQLFPDSPELAAEQQKIAGAKAATGDEQIRHCPFCWAPISAKALKCPSCHSHLAVLKNLTLPLTSGDNQVLTEAKESFAKLPDLHSNPTALYFLALSALNLGDTLEAVSILKEAVTVSQQSKFFVEQLQALDSLIHSYTPKPTEDVSDIAQADEEEADLDSIKAGGTPIQKTILVVEDSTTTRKVIVKTLTKLGYKVVEAVDGLEALSKLNAHKPDLVLLDIILPKMDGYKLLSIIKDDETGLSKTPVIMLTSKDGMLNKLKGKVAGSAAYLTKPFDPRVLIETIEKYL